MRPLILSILLASATSALADDAYLDDRSDPAALVRSLYNAIDRGEFTRAFSYFATPPAASLADYAKGYENTERVDVTVGAASEEGAAGSVYYRLPVVVTAHEKDGRERAFAGCYTLRIANPQIQAETFEPLKIERGDLRPVREGVVPSLPTACADGPPLPENDPVLDKAKAMFRVDFPEICDAPEGVGEIEPERYAFSFRHAADGPDAQESRAHLFRFACVQGAYNQTHVYYLGDADGVVSQIQFARPEIDVHYADENDNTRVDAVTVIGTQAIAQLTNSTFEPETLTMTEHSLWRGVGDASTTSRWVFRNGTFSLVFHEVDASYDGQQNPETLIDYDFTP